jgi:DNA/RNA-binding protein KIN17
MRDENGFKCHVASESHVRNMQIIGEDPRKAINEFSREFERDFLQLLRTGHGEKKVNLNQFYQEYIGNKEHVHMNATKWASLTEFAKYLGRAGICRVEEDEKKSERGGASGLMIAWIDNSPEALRRQEALKKKERQDRGDEEREQRLIQAQIKKAKRQGLPDMEEEEADDVERDTGVDWKKRNEGGKVVLSFGLKKDHAETSQPPTPPLTDKGSGSENEGSAELDPSASKQAPSEQQPPAAVTGLTTKTSSLPATKSISLSLPSSKPKNVFAAASKKNAFGGAKKASASVPQKPMSEAERIMKEEIERKRQRETGAGNVFKKQRLG